MALDVIDEYGSEEDLLSQNLENLSNRGSARLSRGAEYLNQSKREEREKNIRHPTEKSAHTMQRPHLLSPMTKVTENEIFNRMASPTNLHPSASNQRKDMRRQSDFAL